MTPKEQAAMQQALEALENNLPFNYVANGLGELFPCFSNDPLRESKTREAITALREALDQHKPHKECECSDCLNYFTDKAHEEALAEQAEQEPVAFQMICSRCKVDRVTTPCPRGGVSDCPMTAKAQSAALVAAHEREQWKKESEAKDQLALAELHYGIKCK